MVARQVADMALVPVVVTVTNARRAIVSRHTVCVTPIPEQDIRAELDRILATKAFTGAGRLSKLLRYVVEKTLAGETDQLKEYSVGIEVFDRDEKYDPRLDSIVRVEAGRLRSRLDEYYNGNGAGSTVRISLPRGGYTARFEQLPPTPASPDAPMPAAANIAVPVRRSRAVIPLAVALLCIVSVMVWWLATRDRAAHPDLRPTAAVLPIEANMIGGDNDNYSAQMTEAITSELARLGTISVASYTSAMAFQGKHGPMSEVSAALKSNYVVEASVDDEASEILVVARIVDARTDRKMWVSDYRGARDDVRGMAQRIAFDISTAILKKESER
jgi:adenylate cyclase